MRLIIAAVVLEMSAASSASETNHDNPRSVIEAYIAAALTGKADEAASLNVEGQEASSESTIRDKISEHFLT